jgi:hypothetical protein
LIVLKSTASGNFPRDDLRALNDLRKIPPGLATTNAKKATNNTIKFAFFIRFRFVLPITLASLAVALPISQNQKKKTFVLLPQNQFFLFKLVFQWHL